MPLLLFSSQDGATTARRETLLARRALVRLCGTETAAFRSALGSVMLALDRPGILFATKTVASSMQSPTKSALAKLIEWCAICWGFLQFESVSSRQGVPKYLDVHGDEEVKRSITGVTEKSSEVTRSKLRWRRNRWLRCLARRRSSAIATVGPRVDCKRVTS